MKKIKHILLSVMILASAILGSACNQEQLRKEDIPDYSKYDHQFDFFGYHSAHDGYYYVDDAKFYVGESFLTTEQYQMYKDAGMTIFYPQSILKVDTKGGREQGWEKLRTEIDKLVAIGMDKTVLYDEDLSWLGLNEPHRIVGDGREDEDLEADMTDGERTAKGLIGTDADQFDTIEELDARVEELLSLYAGYPGVHGVCLADEPKNVWYKSYGDLYNSIKRVSEKNGWNLYISFNLNPLNVTKYVCDEFYPYVEGTDGVDPATGKVNFDDAFVRYKQYIENFLSSMNPDYIRYDDYPLRAGYLSPTYIPCLQYIAGVARDRNIDFHMVTQTFEMSSNGQRSMRKLTEPGAKWLNNMLLGFGVNEISYFTYYTRTENRTDGESFIEYNNSSFVNLYGQKTNIYDFMKEIMANNQKFAPAVLQFDYKKSGVFTKLPANLPDDHLTYVENINAVTFDKVKNISVNKECAMVNELYDPENDRYMYMAMNIIDPDYKGSPAYQTITLEFDKAYKYALVYKDGESSLYKLSNSKLNVKGAPGDASFVIPF